MMEEIFSRPGQFRLKGRNIRTNPEAALVIMSKVIIVRCEHHFHNDTTEYTGYSMLFDKVLDGIDPPFYEFTVDGNFVEAARQRDIDELDRAGIDIEDVIKQVKQEITSEITDIVVSSIAELGVKRRRL